MNLFDKTEMNGMKLKNRFWKSASWEALATDEGHMTDELFKVYEELAKGGVGTILTGYAYVTEDEKPNPKMMGIYSDAFIEEYKTLTSMAHDNDSNIVMQIVYGGSMSTMEPLSERILGASAIQNDRTGITPIEMTKEDILNLTQSYADAAERVKKSNFDGVELHAAHGYLLSQFLCPYYNKRTDEYGGSIENRARFIIEIVQAIRKKVGENYPVLIKLNSEDFMEDGLGLTSEESIQVAVMLEKAGISAIEVSGGNESSQKVLDGNKGPARTKVAVSEKNESYFAEHAKKLANTVNVPVILTGGNRHLEVMENILENSKIAYFALGRPLICQPDLINIWRQGNRSKPKCISCNKCYTSYGKRCIFSSNKNR
jgi:2,4-dienoyl-CoA reductase-like NADH-dependent reductase (Old Yellow Enzyme family)